MTRQDVCAILLLFALMASTPARAQSTSARADTTAGTHTVTFNTPQGTVRLHVSSDAAPGDVISGLIAVEPAGATQQDRDANVGRLNGLFLEFQGQQTSVASARYEWLVPASLRTGSAPLSLRGAEKVLLSQSSVPIDPVPAPGPRAGSRDETFELPTEAETGRTAVIRGRFDRSLAGKTVTFAGTEAALLASSSRQLVFRVPSLAPGLVPVRVTANGRVVDGSVRILDVRLSASRTQLFRGQRAELAVTVSGLDGITAPVTLTLVNQSPTIVRIDNIDRPITIAPGQVRRGGTFSATRRMTGIEPGPFQISASVGKPPLAQFDVPRSMTRILDDWYATTGVRITTDANELVQRSVLGTRTRLDEFLSQQRANQGDVQDVFAALLSHYCFDLRDDGLARTRAAGPLLFNAFIRPVAFGQNRTSTVEITSNEVRRQSFADYLSRLVSRFTARQAAGYLFVRSMPVEAPITLDGERRGELTDRRLVTPAGDHQIAVGGPKPCRQRVTVNAFQTEVVECGG
jgi:IPT/TIG domain-containing protein